MYLCGPTVYNFSHIGNLRTFLFEDILRRTLKFFGWKVTQVMNLTDVDDKTIRGANEEGVSLREFTDRYVEAFFEDLDALFIERAEHYPRELSGGQEQRVAIARAIASDPTLLLCDEPTGDLDRQTADEILALLRALNDEHGKTVIMVTHDPRAAGFARRTVHLDKGRIVDEAPA